jgi:hypothetical protein
MPCASHLLATDSRNDRPRRRTALQRQSRRPSTPLLSKFMQKLLYLSHHSSHKIGVDTGVDNLPSTGGLVRRFYTTPPTSTARARLTPNHPQATPNPTHEPRRADIPSSPICTGPNTVAHLSLKFLPRRRGLGTQSPHRLPGDLPSSMSARAISFQVDAESSTVVQRQPLRSPQRILVGRGDKPGNRCLALIVMVIEGTLWTWRRQRLVSPI